MSVLDKPQPISRKAQDNLPIPKMKYLAALALIGLTQAHCK